MPKQKTTQKEKNIFFAALLGGILGGAIANFFVSSVYRTIDKPTYINFIITILLGLVFLGICLLLFKQIKKDKK